MDPKKFRCFRHLVAEIDGQPFYSIYGGEGEGGRQENGGKGAAAGGGDPAGGGGGTDPNNSGGSGDGNSPPAGDNDLDDEEEELDKITDPKDREIAELKRENRRKKRELRTAEEAKTGLQTQIDEAARSKNTELKNAQDDLKAANERIAKMEATLHGNLLRTAILENQKLVWHDIATVIPALDMDEIKINVETGEIDGLSEELKRVAKEKPFLVKSKQSEKTGGGNSGGGGGGNNNSGGSGFTGSSGYNPNNSGTDRQSQETLAERQRLEKKYKVLRRP